MTRYDPFAKSPAKSDAARVAPPRQEEDMLFATGEPVKQAPPAESNWDFLNEQADGQLPNAGTLRDAELFAAEILGEETPAPTQRAQPQRATEPTAPPQQSPKPTQKTTQPKPTQKTTPVKPTQAKANTPKQVTPDPRAVPAARVAVRTLHAPVAPAPIEQQTKTPLTPIMPMRPTRQRHGVSKYTPAIVFGVGASVAAWLALVQRNYVLGAIVGCATIVGVVFAWLWRRN
jgi:hypothetical protein